MKVNIVMLSKMRLFLELEYAKGQVQLREGLLASLRARRDTHVRGLRKDLKRYQELQKEYYG